MAVPRWRLRTHAAFMRCKLCVGAYWGFHAQLIGSPPDRSRREKVRRRIEQGRGSDPDQVMLRPCV